jgi:AraC-like DNA-binding protein
VSRLVPRKRQGFFDESLYVVPHRVVERASHHPLLHELHVTDAGCFPNAKHHYRRREAGSTEHILLLCEDGSGFARAGNKEIRVVPQSFVVIPADVGHEYEADDSVPWSLQWFHFAGLESMRYWGHLPFEGGPYGVPPSTLESTSRLFSMLFDVLSRGYSLEHLIAASALVRSILSLLCFDNSSVRDRTSHTWRPAVEATVARIQERLDEPIHLEDLARSAKLSVSRLNTVFREATGDSPMAFVSKLRVQRACHYLEATEATVSEIAFKVGYSDPLYFSRAFKKSVGLSPNQYRSSLRNEPPEQTVWS